MNVLFTCAGRRNYLIEYFRDALKGNGKIFATDASDDAPAMQEADVSIIVPSIFDPEYYDKILEICRDNDIKLLMSLNDLELPLLAERKDIFASAGVQTMISSPKAIDIAFDKLKTLKFAEECGLASPVTVTSIAAAKQAIADGIMNYPLIIKPRWGSGSIGLEIAENEEDLTILFNYTKKKLMKSILSSASAADMDNSLMIQNKIPGKEYGMDIVNDFNGNFQTVFARQKIAMRDGSTDKAISVIDERLDNAGKIISEKLNHVGTIDCDMFIDGDTVYLLELNPRFGGGYPFSHSAGANIPAALIAWVKGETPDPAWHTNYRPGIRVSRCDRMVITGKF